MDEPVYAGFGKRLVAGVVDFIVLIPVIVLNIWLGSLSRTAAMLILVPMAFLYFGYEVYFHARFGQTIGKMAGGIRVLTTDGQRISFRHAFLRSSVDLAFAIISIAGSFMALMHFPNSEYTQLGWMGQTHRLEQLYPVWRGWTSIASDVWVWSEIFTVLFNRKRRAIHDFIAGTIVVVLEKGSPALIPELAPRK